MTSLSDLQKDAVARALNLRADIRRFQQTWPTPNAPGELAPPFTWAQLERQLSSLAANPRAALMAPDLVGATRKQAAFKPPEMVLREILCVAGTLMDESFLDVPATRRAPSDIGEAPMT
ncbi:hypothetical protein [Caulobacter sp. LARHSG274]